MREISFKKLLTVHFVGVVSFIIFNYYVLVVEFMRFLDPHPYSSTTRIVALIIFHIFFFMLAWSMIQSIISDPGRVPIYWGFLAEANDNNQRRYCLLCHCFKPERCHHCSTCGRCVLNMDHHCPWISNCVGYTNRKFFILFLVYVIISLIVALVIETPLMIIELKGLGSIYAFGFHTVLRAIGYFMQLSFLIVIITFFKFHFELMMTNSTTLDNLERQRNPSAGPNVFNVGSYDNFTQVFGNNEFMWPFPIFGSSLPNGDGMIWRKEKI